MENSMSPPTLPVSTQQQLAIKIENLNYFFGEGEIRKQVLFDISLDLPAGQIVILTGPSGSGKTTLLTLVGALRTLKEGNLKVLGQELVGLENKELTAVRRNIGFIFQAHNLFNSLSASQNVEMSIELTGRLDDKRQRAAEILTQLGLKERVDYKPKALSGGQKQRVAIARALVNRPKIILADEPTAALDKAAGRDVVNLMRRQCEEDGTTVLIVTHDNRIRDIADRIINLVDGRLESDSNPTQYRQRH